MYSTIAFTYQPSIAFLRIDTMELQWITDTKNNDIVFNKLSNNSDFDYYYINKILIIPDPIPSPRLNWYKKIIINHLEIECAGKYLYFLNYDTINNIIVANSLTFPQFIFLKNNIDII